MKPGEIFKTEFCVGPFYTGERLRITGKQTHKTRVYVSSISRKFAGWIDKQYLVPLYGIADDYDSF